MIDFFRKSGAMTKRVSGIAKIKGLPKVNPREPSRITRVGTFSKDGKMLAAVLIEVVDTPDSRARGMMGRESVPEVFGMLFEGLSGGGNFWMKDCVVPLDIAFMDKDGTVTKTYSMPIDKDGKNRYDYSEDDVSAIEVKMGMLEKWGVEKGTKFRSRPLDGNGGKEEGNG